MSQHLDSERPRPAPPVDAGLFGDRPLPAAPAPPAARRSTRPARWLVPLALLIVIIGGLAWLLQNMPAWRTPKTDGGAPTPTLAADLLKPGLDPKDLPKKKDNVHIPEFEKGGEGKRWWPFKNVTSEPLELSLFHTSCDCSHVDAAVVSEPEWRQAIALLQADINAVIPENPAWTWAPLPKTHSGGAEVPGDALLLLRMTWNVRKEPGSTLNLEAGVLARSRSSGKQHKLGVSAPAVIRRALEMSPDRFHVGVLGPGDTGQAKFHFWSPTRDDVVMDVKDPHTDGLVVVQKRALDAAERARLQKELLGEKDRTGEKINTRVRCAYEVIVTVHEQKGERQLDQGPLHRALDVEMENSADVLPPLLIVGVVKGSQVQVGGVEDQGRVQLKSFKAADGARKTVVIRTDHATELAIEKHAPAAVEVKLKESTKEKTATQRKWLLEVYVPPNAHYGPFDEDHVIQLRTSAKPPRRIRIPLVGNAVQG